MSTTIRNPNYTPEEKKDRIGSAIQNVEDASNPVEGIFGALSGLVHGKSNRDRQIKAYNEAFAKQVDAEGKRYYARDAQGNLMSRDEEGNFTVPVQRNAAGRYQATEKNAKDVMEKKGYEPPQYTETTKADNDYTLNDIIAEVGDDPAKVREWLSKHPGYEIGDKTRAYLGETTESPKSNGGSLTGQAGELTNTNTDVDDKADEGIATNDPKKVQEAADEKADSVADQLSDKRSKYDTKQITRNIFDAYANGDFGEPGTQDAKMARNYFIMDSLLTASKNWAKRDEHYIHNLQNIVSGREATDYDTSKDEKSRWEQMRDRAQERYEQGQDTLAKSDYDTAANIGTQEQNAMAAENMGTQGMAQAAGFNQISQGNFDALTQAYASGDESQIKAAQEAALKDPVVQQQIQELQLRLQNATFDADVEAAKLANSLTQQQIAQLTQATRMLGYEGDLKQVLTSFVKDLQNGKIDAGTMAALGGMGILSKIGVM